MDNDHNFDGLMPLLNEIDRAAKKQDWLSVSDLFQTLGECSFGQLMLRKGSSLAYGSTVPTIKQVVGPGGTRFTTSFRKDGLGTCS
jgi:hypothetical protein